EIEPIYNNYLVNKLDMNIITNPFMFLNSKNLVGNITQDQITEIFKINIENAAKKYWNCEMSNNPIIEILINCDCKVIRKIE
ncbi:MAG: hypothetical protein WC393_05365, partial [Candidatus Nanoarchaeia archaeon]